MNPESNWLFPSTPVETVLKSRPLTAEVFARLGLNPWKAPHESVGDLCAESGVPWADFFREVTALPVPPVGSDWSALPLPHLLDLLVSQHREFLHEFLPAIGHVLSGIPDPDAASMAHLRTLAEEWPAFAASLSAHIREEEDVLFLRLLRYDACSRLGTASPDFEGGSVRVFTVVRMLEHEHRDMALFRRFLSKALPAYPGPGGDALELRLRPLLAGFEGSLGRHARLETEVLFPRGAALEKGLYDLHIRGKLASRDAASALSASTRG
jgi:regulator of cell morphogenesis and NO signaling